MKKTIILLLVLLCLLQLAACTDRACTAETQTIGGEVSIRPEADTIDTEKTKDLDEKAKDPDAPDWGITLTAENVTASGLTIVCTQSGGMPAGELDTGSYYTVQRLTDGHWEKVEYTELEEEQVGWTGEAWIIPMEDTVEWEVDWTWLYGELPAGQYRIGKEIMDFIEAGNYEKFMFFAEFTIG